MKLPAIFRRRSTVTKAGVPAYGVGSGWSTLFRYRPRGDIFPGSWQRDISISPDEMRQHHAVFAVESQIASDVAKMRLRLVQLSGIGGYWSETTNPAYSPVLATPNSYQDQGQFLESWLWSLLNTGNFYGLKERDGRGVVIGIYPLDPMRVMPLVSNDGQINVFYQLSTDNMAGITEPSVIVPAREVIHHRINTVHHPLCGVSPLYAASGAAAGGLAMVRSQARFFARGSQLSGVLTAPASIDPDTAKRLEDQWENEYMSGEGTGRIAVLGSGLEFKSLQMSAVDAQIIDQMKWSAMQVCSVFAMPPWKIGLDVWPRGVVNVQSLAVEYLSGCLQRYVEGIERCLSTGLGLPSNMRAGLDETGLLRMDGVSLGDYLRGLVQAGIMAPNEARAKLGLPPVVGGDIPLAQQQMWPIDLLSDPSRGVPGAATAPAQPAEAK